MPTAPTKLLEVPLTPADFALSEGRFRKHFRQLAADADGVPIHEYVDLPGRARRARRRSSGRPTTTST